jgi:hypothetical protein
VIGVSVDQLRFTWLLQWTLPGYGLVAAQQVEQGLWPEGNVNGLTQLRSNSAQLPMSTTLTESVLASRGISRFEKPFVVYVLLAC